MLPGVQPWSPWIDREEVKILPTTVCVYTGRDESNKLTPQKVEASFATGADWRL